MITNFIPSDYANWKVQVSGVLKDGTSTYLTLTSFYNHYSNRYYLRATGTGVGEIFFLPMVSSHPDNPVYIGQAFLNTKIMYDATTNRVEVTNA